jgi:DNA-binding NarL/FixJ family response regulator
MQTQVKKFKASRGERIKMFRTLIVEDSVFFRHLLRETLNSKFPKMQISEAADGEEALQKIKTLPPDLIFMDIKMPGESGLVLTKHIKTQYPNIIVIFLTSYDTPEYREAAIRYKADFFLSKGSSTREGILTLVKSILSRQAEDPSRQAGRA